MQRFLQNLCRRIWEKSKRILWLSRREVAQQQEEQRRQIAELRRAWRDWMVARHRFDAMCSQDQIDYAIYALEAAEKRYEMLLREAKRNQLRAIDARTGQWLEVPR